MKHILIGIATLAASPAAAQDLPQGAGREAVVKLCSNCHGLTVAVSVRHSREQWEAVVDDMAQRGAVGTDQEFDAVVAYLSRYLGKVNINNATPTEMQEVADFSSAEAEAIVRYRTKHDEFKSFADLQKIPDIDQKRLDARKDRISFK